MKGLGWGGSLADATLHGALATTDAAVLVPVPALALALGKYAHGHRVREAQRPNDKRLLLDTLCGRDLHLEGDLCGEQQGSGEVRTLRPGMKDAGLGVPRGSRWRSGKGETQNARGFSGTWDWR